MQRSTVGDFGVGRRKLALAAVFLTMGMGLLWSHPAHAGLLPAQTLACLTNVGPRTATAHVAPAQALALSADAAVAAAGKIPIYFHRKRLLDEVSAKNGVLLTFDDGPNPNTTPLVLDALKRHRLQAVFFVVGMNVRKHPELVKRIHDEGHIIGNHTFFHADLTRFGTDRILQEIRTTNDLVAKITGERPRFFRPPYGAVNSRVWKIVSDEGMDVVMWTVDPWDWRTRNATRVLAKLTAGLGLGTAHVRGGVVLLHDILPSTVEALEPFLARLRSTGLTPLMFAGHNIVPVRTTFDPISPNIDIAHRPMNGPPQTAQGVAASARGTVVKFNVASLGNPMLRAWLEPALGRPEFSILALLKAKQRGDLMPFMLAAYGGIR